jgi:hypothetical protein
LLVAIGTSMVIGLASLVAGIWGLWHQPVEGVPYRLSGSPIGAVVAGLIFSGFGLAELIHRVRTGPEVPGRHTRGDER